MKHLTKSILLGQVVLQGTIATPWFGTQYVAIVESTIGDGYTGVYITEDPVVRTYTKVITPTVSNPTVLSTITSTETYYNGDITAVQLVVEPTAGVQNTGYNYVGHYASVTYTAPSSCLYTTSQSLITAIPINVPLDAEDLFTPSMKTSTITYKYNTYRYTQTMAFLDIEEIPKSIFSSASSLYKPSMYKTCNSYYSTGRTTYYSGDDDDDDSRSYTGCSKFIYYLGSSELGGGYCCSDGCHYTWGVTPWGLGLAIFFGWFCLFLVIGLIESWFIFRRAMLGRKSRRGLPYGFALLCPILSCLLLITVKKYPAKTPEEQAVLVARWKGMSGGQKLGWWLKYLFRRRDPAAVALARPSPGPVVAPYPPGPGPWYPPPGAAAPGVPPMVAYPSYPLHGYPPHGYPPSQGYPSPLPAEADATSTSQPKTVSVSETERTERT
ncbi:hypothetical protein PENANT_c017G11437 [Penicillium antarcticum]|uniref:Uncharacterized protein n=1 Tax=Penicillium antarcticum TaxID=416450 RepID=A0A1V6Q241_9EURO|nr:uncharacterized protein N7508_005423 [Penicillium antarcticum]KAJ5306408.1 hypothetical protein N7508_005423 [Penicillium antarcticum]OQD83358.1 hypothetical protein PENANT_c017G11437 [Penicillium antarcticum]